MNGAGGAGPASQPRPTSAPASAAELWARLTRGLREAADEALEVPGRGRVGAALVLAHDPGDGDLEFVYTRRRDDLSNHPGQISFPGGRVDPGETVEEAAVREAAEEVALDASSATVLGRLPAFYIPPSRFWLQPVIARWDRPHPLVAAEAEVAKVLHVRLSTLLDPDVRRVVALSTRGTSWAWQLDDRHLLWGATAMVTVALLDLLAPRWHGGVTPAALGPDRVVQPWRGEGVTQRLPRPARLHDLPERPLPPTPPGRTGDLQPDEAAAAVALAVVKLSEARRSPTRPAAWRVLVLAGAGCSGHLGLSVAGRLLTGGAEVDVVTAGPAPEVAAPLAGRVRRFDGHLLAEDGPAPDLVVDALVGAGLRRALGGEALDVVIALRALHVPIVAVDVPTGLDAQHGLIGDAIAADVTVSLGEPLPGLLLPGLAPFVGDLYQACDSGLVRLVAPPPEEGWRE